MRDDLADDQFALGPTRVHVLPATHPYQMSGANQDAGGIPVGPWEGWR